MAATIAMFRTKRMLFLSLIFFYTGYNQPYQLNTFGNRIFQKQTIGLEMIVFYVSEIIGGLYVGSMLDQSAGNKLDQRKASKKCLLLFFVVTSLSFILCYFQEVRVCTSILYSVPNISNIMNANENYFATCFARPRSAAPSLTATMRTATRTRTRTS